ncbi:MAG: carbamoyltransferase C-terminal domain-containing protein [Sandaracinus sp.]
MKVLGYNGGLDGYLAKVGNSGHDAAAALVVEGRLVAACEEERLTREKHTGRFPTRAIAYCLEEGGLGDVRELDLVATSFSYPRMYQRGKHREARGVVSPFTRGAMAAFLGGMRAFHRLAGYDDARSHRVLERALGVTVPARKLVVVPHHLCHAASAYFESPFERALCLTLDAEGESTSTMVVRAVGTKLDVLEERFSPNSLGYLYALFTLYLGLDAHDEYKVMGLAPYGDPARYREAFHAIVATLPEGGFRVDPGLVTHLLFRDAALRGTTHLYPRRLLRALGPPRRPDEPITQRHMDLAASLQEALERAVLHKLTHLRRATGERQLCLAGGVALNCTMNGKIARSGLFDALHVHPAAHDAGTSVGAALYGAHAILGAPRPPPRPAEVYLGPALDPREVEAGLAVFGAKIRVERPHDLVGEVAEAIRAGAVVGWCQGRMEWGPRALGNRSILADPRRADMRDRVNHAVKLREGFRPFAPACLLEHASEWLEMTGLRESPHMLFTVPVREEKRARIPAVTHVDGSARVQTVSAAQNRRLHALLTAFHARTGVPILLNTSFNVKGEPIVATAEDALRCFLGTQIDLLVLGDVVVHKRPEVARGLGHERAAPHA